MFDIKLKDALHKEFSNILFDEPMKKHVTMNVGGPADGFLNVDSKNLKRVLSFCDEHSIPVYIFGNGSNTIVRDGGIRGLVLCIGKYMNYIELTDKNTLCVQAGAKLCRVAEYAAKARIGGFEFLGGIPGNLGGALVMNAGAYGGEIKNLIKTVNVIENGIEKHMTADEIGYGYRKSYFIDNPSVIITGAVLAGTDGREEEIRALMADYQNRRTTTQPLEFPSSGSFFKRPKGFFAGKLIQDSDLKGYTVGGAAVSEKHAGFIINKGGATSKDIEMLSDHVKKVVYEKYGVLLEPEVRIIGEYTK